MERKIGEIFEYNGEWYQCVGGTCRNCSFYYDTVCKNITNIGSTNIGNCHCSLRTDHKSVIFKKLEKVGEQFLYKGKQMQSYIRATDELICNWNNNLLLLEHGDSDIIDIEIKQNKEDMEEKKLNLKPFDIQKAREGKPVCTRDGRKARIICFDRRLFYKNVSYPILALVECSDGEDDVCGYNEKGKVLIEDGAEYKDDLMMLPEKKEGWAVIRKSDIYETEEQAKEVLLNSRIGVMIRKINWEE